MKTHTSHDKGGGHAFPGQAPAPAWPWVTAWPGPSQRQPPRSLSEPPDAPTATLPSGVRYIRLPRRGTARGAALAAPTGSGEGGEDGSGDAGDAHGWAAAAGALRDAHGGTCGHESSSTVGERCTDGADMARVRGPAAAAHRLDESRRAPGRPLVGGSRGTAPGTQTPSCRPLQRRWSGRQRIGHPHACTQTRPLHAQAVCMAHAAGAHLHRFIEWVESVILKCSDAAWSTHLMSRCRIYRRQNHALDLLATASTCRTAAPNEHGESANSTSPSGVVGSAKFRTPSGRHWHATSGT